MTAEQLADAKAKYHLLLTGQSPRVILDGNSGDRLEFQGANVGALLDYIRTADPSFLAAVMPSALRRPIQFTF